MQLHLVSIMKHILIQLNHSKQLTLFSYMVQNSSNNLLIYRRRSWNTLWRRINGSLGQINVKVSLGLGLMLGLGPGLG